VKSLFISIRQVARGGARFSELRGSRSSGCRFTAVAGTRTPSFTHPKSSNLRKSHGSFYWRLGVRTWAPHPPPPL